MTLTQLVMFHFWSGAGTSTTTPEGRMFAESVGPGMFAETVEPNMYAESTEPNMRAETAE